MFEICSDLSKIGLKIYYFCQHSKGPNHFISGKQFQKGPNLADLAFKKAKWQPWYLSSHSVSLAGFQSAADRLFCIKISLPSVTIRANTSCPALVLLLYV